MSPSALILLLAAPASVGGQWSTTVTGGMSGGWVAITPNDTARPTISTVVGPGAAVSLTAGTLTGSFNYNLSMTRRFEFDDQYDSLNRFLLMHTAGANAGWRLRSGWTLGAQVTSTFGEVDVPTANQLQTAAAGQAPGTNPGAGGSGTTGAGTTGGTTLPTNAAVVDPSGVIRSVQLSYGASLSGRMSKAWNLTLTMNGAYTGPLGSVGTSTVGFGQVRQSSVGANMRLSRTLTRRDSINLVFVASYSTSELLGSYGSGGVTGGYARKLGRYSTISAGIGFLAIRRLGDLPMMSLFAPPPETSITPALNLSFDSRLFNFSFMSATYGLRSSIASQQNFLTGALEPRLTTSASINLAIGRSWTVSPAVFFNTVVAFQQAPTAPVDPAQQDLQDLQFLTETTLAVSLPVEYQVSQGFSITGAFTYNAYGKRLIAPDFALLAPGYQFSLNARMLLNDKF